MAFSLQGQDIWLDDAHKWIGMPVNVASTPAAGRIVASPATWLVATKGACAWVVFYKRYVSPQKNSSEALMTRFRERVAEDLKPYGFLVETRGLSYTFLPHNCHDYI